MKKVYITTSIPYVNAKPHVGFAMELCQADALARYYRQKLGDENVFLLSGTDEHGLKVQKSAKEAGVTEQAFTDEIAGEFKKLIEKINFSGNGFVRTTDDSHHKSASEIWKRCRADIYKKKYQALYCAGCEEFKTEKDLVDGYCPTHKEKPELVEEENYFFALSKYASKLQELIESDKLKITPTSRKNEVLNWLKEGVEDVSVSREAKRLKWGIPVPGDPEQTMYVWVDALSNYITGTGFPEAGFEKWWNEDTLKIHVIGKDILRFHAIIWTGLLLSAGLPLPNEIYAHGHITVDNQKMSKSLGNVIDPFEIIEKYGADPLRYYLLSKIPWDDDGDFTTLKFRSVYKGELSDNWGNLLNRMIVLAKKFGVEAEKGDQKAFEDQNLAKYSFNNFIEEQIDLFSNINKQINEEQPWLLTEGDSKGRELVNGWLKSIYDISNKLAVITPETFDRIQETYQTGQPIQLFPRID